MKKIALLMFTFSGICGLFGQKPAPANSPGNPYTVMKPWVKLFPNPVKHKAELELAGFEGGYVQLEIYDSRGYRVRNEKRMLYTGNDIILMMFALQPGLYILSVKQNNRTVRKKMMVE